MTETEIFETIRYTADIVCVRGSEILAIRRGWPPHQGALALPGGHVDLGETSRAAAARELLEETGVRVHEEDLTLVGVWDAPGRDPRGRYVTAAYMVVVPADTTAQAGDDAAEAVWLPFADPGPLAFDHGAITYAAWRLRLTAIHAELDAAEMGNGRCPAVHPSDPSDCDGPTVVTVVDSKGVGVDGCRRHAARMVASLTAVELYALPDAPAGAASRVREEAAALPPYVWLQPNRR
ncbi:NUDIX domain-containing protein [Streptomyces sp. enrichment culture]|uniref:NUDIX domain-containing protein n=1 Tax=Streptomyces sp. enrichment culture TaxID=1795815 RepID=UPI003F558815